MEAITLGADDWLTSDWHLGHLLLSEKWRSLGPVADMNRTILTLAAQTVRPGGRLWHHGDFAMGTIAETLPLVGELPFEVHLIGGNHDRFTLMYEDREHKRAEWAQKYLDAGFASVTDGHVIATVDGHRVLMSHLPYTGDRDEERFSDQRPPDTGLPQFHGHLHSSPEKRLRGRMLDVGVDAWGFRPVNALEALSTVLGA